jgi:hypothetical protein
MKGNVKKILLLIFVILLISILAGCEPHFLDGTGTEDADCAEQTAYDYWRAIINRQYELAKFYCVPDGIWYNKVDEWEKYINANSEGGASVIVSFYEFYSPTVVSCGIAYTYPSIFVDIVPYPGSSSMYGENFAYVMLLIRDTSPPGSPPGSWKLE